MATSPKDRPFAPEPKYKPTPEPKYRLTPAERDAMTKTYAKGGLTKAAPAKPGDKKMPPWLKPKAPGMKAGGMKKKGC